MKDLNENEVQVKRALCPKCGNPVLVGVLHHLTSKNLREYERLQSKNGCTIDTIPLLKYREDNLPMCFLQCNTEAPLKLSPNPPDEEEKSSIG